MQHNHFYPEFPSICPKLVVGVEGVKDDDDEEEEEEEEEEEIINGLGSKFDICHWNNK